MYINKNTFFSAFLVPVKRRNKATLWPIIFQYIKPGTHIISDGWKAYNGLGTVHCYTHEVVNHSVGFVNENAEHTNTMEGSWFHAKRSLPQHGTRKSMLGNYFAQFMWRRKYMDTSNKFEAFPTFLSHIADIHNPNSENNFTYGDQQQTEAEQEAEVENEREFEIEFDGHVYRFINDDYDDSDQIEYLEDNGEDEYEEDDDVENDPDYEN
jgi:transposase-like protein